MSDDVVHHLGLVKAPTVEENIKEDLVTMLELLLQEAKDGDITEAFILVQHPDKMLWSDRSSLMEYPTLWLGRLEVAKADLIDEIRASE